MVFSLKLDNGHKLLCPWIDNTCDERLAEFPPTPPQVLVEKFRERSCALLRLLALPLISSSAIEYIRCPQLEEFLGQSPTLEFGNMSANLSHIQFLGNDCDAGFANLYYEVHSFLTFVSNITFSCQTTFFSSHYFNFSVECAVFIRT